MHYHSADETIVAPVTSFNKNSVGIIRISGPLCKKIAKKIIGKIPKNRYALNANFFDLKKNIIDNGIAIYFKKPNSFTGDDVLELQPHGNMFVLDNLIQTILKLGAQYALPGEFSRRAFLNNKISLVEAEAICDLINSESKIKTQIAASAIKHGIFEEEINNISSKLNEIIINIEGGIDFVDEAHIDYKYLYKILCEIIENTKKLLSTGARNNKIINGVKVVLAGKTNTGKSSLFNNLIGPKSTCAIVTKIHGTTRDVLSETIELDNILIHLKDTAGLRNTRNIVELEGIKKTLYEIENADLILLCFDSTKAHKYQLLQLIKNYPILKNKNIIIVLNKCDLIEKNIKDTADTSVIYTSSKTNAGIDNLIKTIITTLHKQYNNFSKETNNYCINTRHLNILQIFYEQLLKIKNKYNSSKNKIMNEFIAEDIKNANFTLGQIFGERNDLDILDQIFKNFCIGK